jgi:hypothetical protein
MIRLVSKVGDREIVGFGLSLERFEDVHPVRERGKGG